MSYSFHVRETSVENATSKVSEELDKVVAAQPIHTADRDAALKAVETFLSLLPGAPGQDFYVSVSGSLGWTGNLGTADQVITSASVNVSTSLVAKKQA